MIGSWDSLDEEYHLPRMCGKVHLNPSTNQTDYQYYYPDVYCSWSDWRIISLCVVWWMYSDIFTIIYFLLTGVISQISKATHPRLLRANTFRWTEWCWRVVPTPPPQVPTFRITWPPWQGCANFKTCNTRHKCRWIGTNCQKCGDELRHFIHRTHSVITTYRIFFEAAFFNLQAEHDLLLNLATTTFRHPGWLHFTSQKLQACWRNRDHLYKYKFTPRTGS